MPQVTGEQRVQIEVLINEIRTIAITKDRNSYLWDVLDDLRDFLSDERTPVERTAEEWIEFARDMITP